MKFFNSWTFEPDRFSRVSIEHKGQIYEGTAKCHPDDIWSEFTGCKFAELRAMKKALKAQYKEEKLKLDAIKNFITAVGQYKNFDNESPTAKAMYRQYNRRIKQLKEIASDIAAIDDIIKARLKSLEIIEEKRKNSKESKKS